MSAPFRNARLFELYKIALTYAVRGDLNASLEQREKYCDMALDWAETAEDVFEKAEAAYEAGRQDELAEQLEPSTTPTGGK